LGARGGGGRREKGQKWKMKKTNTRAKKLTPTEEWKSHPGRKKSGKTFWSKIRN